MSGAHEKLWYHAMNGSQAGPVAVSELQQLVASGRATRETLVWKEGMATWVPLGTVPDLAPIQPKQPSPDSLSTLPPSARAGAARGRPPAQRAAPNGGWKLRKTVDGGEYFHNVETDEVSWDKPPELQTAEERSVDTSDCVWLSSEVDGNTDPYDLKNLAINMNELQEENRASD